MLLSRQIIRIGCRLMAVLCLAPGLLAKEERPDGKEDVIAQSAEKFVAAYNDHNTEELAKLFTEDAELLPLNEDPIYGREAIGKAFSTVFDANPQMKISLAMEAVKFITPDVAFEDGTTINFADGETPTTRSRYAVVHVKQNGVWRMKLVRELEEEPLTPYARLRDLEWMVGEWIDEGPDGVVATSCRWDDRKSFLIRSFQVKTEGDVVLKGEQKIGWDAAAKRVRSWTFDDAGGFAEGTWTQIDDRWVIKSTGFRPDGKTASATAVITPRGDNRVEWKLEERLVGDTPMPSVTVILVRRPPEPAKSEGD
jgi:uncharacterized protein (TIGR02246 family)